MWVCEICGFELDDSLKSCPFGCGAREAKPERDSETTSSEVTEIESTEISSSIRRLRKDAGDAETFDAAPLSDSQNRHQPNASIGEDCIGSTLILTEGITGSQLEIDCVACVLGREGDYSPEIFSEQVSRAHLEIRREENAWLACHVGLNSSVLVTSSGRTNMAHDIEYPLHDGDRLHMADQTFTVKVQAKEVEAERQATDTPAHENVTERTESQQNGDSTECWCIVCPKCGAKHKVKNESARLSSCHNCTDPMDRREIRRSIPVFGVFRRSELIDAC